MNDYDDAIDAAAWKDVNYSFGSVDEEGQDSFEKQMKALKKNFCQEMVQPVAKDLAKTVGNRIQQASDALTTSVATGVMPEVKVRAIMVYCKSVQSRYFLGFAKLLSHSFKSKRTIK